MPAQPSMRDKILESAEKRVRGAGFAAMSFRDIANDIGIKSASVHYHFPAKVDLGEALIDEYTKRFEGRLAAISLDELQPAIDAFVALYREALVLDESVCLCAIMGAEAIGLPKSINQRTKAFFQMNLLWLEALFKRHLRTPEPELAAMVVAALEGAIIVSSASQERHIFEQVVQAVLRTIVSMADADRKPSK